MRCDNCPLCPIAEDDVCLESEGEFALEHSDGMSGCKHPRSWAEKKKRECDKHYGDMGMDMGIEMSFSEEELKQVIELCKEMVGLNFSWSRPYHRNGKKFYKPEQDWVSFSSPNELLEKMPDCIVEKKVDGRFWYQLTREGLDWLGRRLNITFRDVVYPWNKVRGEYDKMTLILTFLGLDDWNRPVYQDQNGRIWKNIKHLARNEIDVENNIDGLCTVSGNFFDGEPDMPLEYFDSKPTIKFSTKKED